MIRYHPGPNDLREVLSNNISASQSRTFFKEKGILFLAPNKEWIGEEGKLFFFSLDEVERISSYIDTEKNYKKSSRSYIPQADSFDTVNNQLENLYRTGQQGEDHLRVVSRHINENAVGYEVEYVRRKPGMVELLSERTRRVKFTLERNETFESVLVDIQHGDDSDIKQVKKLFDMTTQSEQQPNIDLNDISLDVLTLEERINLFDEFYRYEFDDWAVEEILKIGVKKGNDDEVEEPDDENQDQLLRGIRSAVLNGRSLRSNEFVQAGLRNGFYLFSTRVRLSHHREAKSIEIDMSFKAKAFELNVAKTMERIEDEYERSLFPAVEQEQYLRYFRDVIFTIYRGIYGRRAEVAG